MAVMYNNAYEYILKFGHRYPLLAVGLCFIGAYKVASFALRNTYSFYSTFLRPSRNLFKRYHGGYVVVTGATDGIGKEYARQFAQKGFNLVLISRSQEKLDGVKEEFNKDHPDCDIITIKFDFNIPYTEEGYKPLKDKLAKIEDISVLVNNVGTGKATYFNDMSIEDANMMVQLNCVSQFVTTKFLLDRLLKRSKDENKRTAIINISSVAFYTKMPSM
jgi:17beta-estradiol 17-dehydrogenase / very-long-chain 3-oxoacyl-CoA reductase